jgi:hypothetical protein
MLASGVRELAPLKVADRGGHDLASLDLAHQSFRPRMTAFLSHRTLHKQYRERDHKRQHGDHPKGVEIGKRRPLLLAQIFELLHSQLLGGGWIAGLLNEECLSAREKAAGGCVEGIKILAKPQNVKLITPLLEGLGQRHPDAAPLVA